MASQLSFFQHTLRDPFSCRGVALHCGQQVSVQVMPAEPDAGYIFTRSDIEGRDTDIPGSWLNVVDTERSMTLQNEDAVRVSTVEHLLAALYACGVDNARIVLDGPEVPILDGSAMPFVEFIRTAGTRQQNAQRHAIVIKQTVSVSDGNKFAGFLPSPVPWASCEIDFASPVISQQKFAAPIETDAFIRELALARTFGFREHKARLNEKGLARGASDTNIIVIDNHRIVNQGGLRFEDEFVRHKLVDMIGDLALLGGQLFGHMTSQRGGHRLNHLLFSELMSRPDAWQDTTMREAHSLWKSIIAVQGETRPSRRSGPKVDVTCDDDLRE